MNASDTSDDEPKVPKTTTKPEKTIRHRSRPQSNGKLSYSDFRVNNAFYRSLLKLSPAEFEKRRVTYNARIAKWTPSLCHAFADAATCRLVMEANLSEEKTKKRNKKQIASDTDENSDASLTNTKKHIASDTDDNSDAPVVIIRPTNARKPRKKQIASDTDSDSPAVAQPVHAKKRFERIVEEVRTPPPLNDFTACFVISFDYTACFVISFDSTAL